MLAITMIFTYFLISINYYLVTKAAVKGKKFRKIKLKFIALLLKVLEIFCRLWMITIDSADEVLH